jgi:hypothetical protein
MAGARPTPTCLLGGNTRFLGAPETRQFSLERLRGGKIVPVLRIENRTPDPLAVELSLGKISSARGCLAAPLRPLRLTLSAADILFTPSGVSGL